MKIEELKVYRTTGEDLIAIVSIFTKKGIFSYKQYAQYHTIIGHNLVIDTYTKISPVEFLEKITTKEFKKENLGTRSLQFGLMGAVTWEDFIKMIN